MNTIQCAIKQQEIQVYSYNTRKVIELIMVKNTKRDE